MRFLVNFVLGILLIHRFASAFFGIVLRFLCKYSGRSNYFWAKFAFWAAMALLFVGEGWVFIVFVYGLIPLVVIGDFFIFPSVANKLKRSSGETLPFEIVYVLPAFFYHVINISLSLFFMVLGDHSLTFFLYLAGQLFSYAAFCFLVDKNDGGKSLFRRTKEKLKKISESAKEKIGTGESLPQPV